MWEGRDAQSGKFALRSAPESPVWVRTRAVSAVLWARSIGSVPFPHGGAGDVTDQSWDPDTMGAQYACIASEEILSAIYMSCDRSC